MSQWKEVRRRLWWLSWPIVVAVALVIISTVLSIDRPPVEIKSAALVESVVCGKTLTYRTVIQFRDTPVVMISIRTIWNAETQDTRIFANAGRYAIFTESVLIERELTYELPEPLTPGRYELRISYQTFTSKPAVVALPFVVPVGCP